MGNSAGEWVQGKLNPVGQYAGKGFETIGKPVGGIVDPLVGGVMRSGEAFGETVGVGYGNKEGELSNSGFMKYTKEDQEALASSERQKVKS